jgi:hypothetical protein
MSKRLIITLAVAWIVSLVGVATVVAQVATHMVPPKIFSGSDVGFRVERIDPKAGSVIGKVVVNVNGQWVDAEIGGGSVKLAP